MIFLGTAPLISSSFHLALTIIYRISIQWLILSEERWRMEIYAEDYRDYFSLVSRYFII